MEPTIKHIYRSAAESDAAAGQAPVDVVVLLTNGDQYVASFFPYASIAALHEAHKTSGAYLNGAYFWSKNLVLVADCGAETVERVVRAILEDGELGVVFERV